MKSLVKNSPGKPEFFLFIETLSFSKINFVFNSPENHFFKAAAVKPKASSNYSNGFQLLELVSSENSSNAAELSLPVKLSAAVKSIKLFIKNCLFQTSFIRGIAGKEMFSTFKNPVRV
jgi:hypothetical protein